MKANGAASGAPGGSAVEGGTREASGEAQEGLGFEVLSPLKAFIQVRVCILGFRASKKGSVGMLVNEEANPKP